jgi:hypothetical protein
LLIGIPNFTKFLMVDGDDLLREAVTSSSRFQFTLLLCLCSYSVAKEACPVTGYTYSAATETDYAKASTFGTAAIGLSSGGEGYLGGGILHDHIQDIWHTLQCN